ncbi:heavy metal-binding protein HIP-like [Thunnus thynnus]|uniref:heavy metal-binding protein HIP-like n=1 Tax=Thunnus thynnus TaxID=8237 RepID=UPI003527F494
MRRAAAFLALLLCLYWTTAQGESGGVTENDITQTDVRPEILGVKATSDQTNITPDIWDELKALREMVIQHSMELRDSKSKIEKLEQENTDLEARLSTSEKVVEELKTENTAIQARLTASEIKNAALEARMNASEKVVEELMRENIDLEARLSTSEKAVEELKTENTDLEARMSSTELQVEELKGGSADRPKVAFSAGIANNGYIGPYGDWTTLKFNNIYTNIGEAYNPNTGIFTAPVRGAYYFRFSGWDMRSSMMGIQLNHNGTMVFYSFNRTLGGGFVAVSNGCVLQLEKGDVIELVLRPDGGIFDDGNDENTFSGFLLFAM